MSLLFTVLYSAARAIQNYFIPVSSNEDFAGILQVFKETLILWEGSLFEVPSNSQGFESPRDGKW